MRANIWQNKQLVKPQVLIFMTTMIKLPLLLQAQDLVKLQVLIFMTTMIKLPHLLQAQDLQIFNI
jgi:hypothetical protein